MRGLLYFWTMHKTFLEEVLDDLERRQIAFDACRFVLPGKRSGTFLKQHIARRLERPIFAPEIFSIQEFMEQRSGMQQATSLESLLLLHKAYRASGLGDQTDFSGFVQWGQTLLQDFMAIDGNLLPPGEILNYLSAIKELDHWSLSGDKTPIMDNYLRLWSKLEEIYLAFDAAQRAAGRAHPGLIQRLAVERLQAGELPPWDNTTVFVGFNALGKAESETIQHMLASGGSLIYWDIDPAILEDPIHEAGFFIRKYLREWPYYQKGGEFLQGKTGSAHRSIDIIGVPKNMAQTKYTGNLLRELGEDPQIDFRDTALVLADEGLLQPMLKAIPDSLGEVNITMGLPLVKTMLFSFFHIHLELCLNRSRRGWFHKPLLEFLSNPYTQTLSARGKTPFAQQLAREIKGGNYLYLEPEMLLKYGQAPGTALFPDQGIGPALWIKNCLSLIGELKIIHQSQGNSLELEYLYRFHTLFNQLGQHLGSMDLGSDLKSIKILFRQLASTETLDFIGEPLSGLQIMGMLESRNLDFTRVIITSVNEGILPGGKSNNSFIPFDVKRQYGLPTHKERDAIYTYHFYRLIQRAESVHIIYNTEADVLEGGEKSRLIAQLLTDPGPKRVVRHSLAAPKLKIRPAEVREIEKGDALLQALKDMAERGFSPSSLTNYLRNPIDFHKQNLLGIDQVEEVEETMAANIFGTIIHACLEALYKPLLGRVLRPEALSELLPTLPELVRTHFRDALPGVDSSRGRFLLVHHVILRYLENFLRMEAEASRSHQIEILELEKKYRIPLQLPGLDFPIFLKGTLDRVDRFDGQLRVIDYKTGKVESKEVRVLDWAELIQNADRAKAFQLLCYAYLHHREQGALPIRAGLITFKNLGQGPLFFKEDKNDLIDRNVLDRFEAQLHNLIRELFDPAFPLREKKP